MDTTTSATTDRDNNTRNNGTRYTLTRRVTVYFDGPAHDDSLVLEYAATDTEAWEFTAAAVHAGLTVTVDSRIRPGLRRLPCHRLWQGSRVGADHRPSCAPVAPTEHDHSR